MIKYTSRYPEIYKNTFIFLSTKYIKYDEIVMNFKISSKEMFSFVIGLAKTLSRGDPIEPSRGPNSILPIQYLIITNTLLHCCFTEN